MKVIIELNNFVKSEMNSTDENEVIVYVHEIQGYCTIDDLKIALRKLTAK